MNYYRIVPGIEPLFRAHWVRKLRVPEECPMCLAGIPKSPTHCPYCSHLNQNCQCMKRSPAKEKP